jgi:hypothetical protein
VLFPFLWVVVFVMISVRSSLSAVSSRYSPSCCCYCFWANEGATAVFGVRAVALMIGTALVTSFAATTTKATMNSSSSELIQARQHVAVTVLYAQWQSDAVNAAAI